MLGQSLQQKGSVLLSSLSWRLLGGYLYANRSPKDNQNRFSAQECAIRKMHQSAIDLSTLKRANLAEKCEDNTTCGNLWICLLWQEPVLIILVCCVCHLNQSGLLGVSDLLEHATDFWLLEWLHWTQNFQTFWFHSPNSVGKQSKQNIEPCSNWSCSVVAVTAPVFQNRLMSCVAFSPTSSGTFGLFDVFTAFRRRCESWRESTNCKPSSTRNLPWKWPNCVWRPRGIDCFSVTNVLLMSFYDPLRNA